MDKDYIKLLYERDALYENYARKRGLQGKALQFLMWLVNYPKQTGKPITQKVLVEKTYSTKQVVNATIKNWQQRGYLEMVPMPTDKRHKYLALTPAGREYAQGIVGPLNELETQAFKVLSSAQQESLLVNTEAYLSVLKEKLAENERKSNQ